MSGGAGTPLYARVLRLRHLNLATWQRVLYVEGAVAVGVVLALGELASAWTILALPLLLAAVVKFHDVLAGLLASTSPADPEVAGVGGRPGGRP